MSSRLLASVLMPCLLAVGFLGIAPVAAADSGGSVLKAGKSARLKPGKSPRIVVNKRRGQGVRIHLPIGPAYVYQDYPYYYSRGHYPTHIGGYVYYPYQYHRGY
jgi:hypothetical protein